MFTHDKLKFSRLRSLSWDPGHARPTTPAPSDGFPGMMGAFDQGPLSDEELEELDQFLLHAEGIEESMDVSMLDGFLTAIVSGPKTIMPSEWMRWVWDVERGEDTPAFKDQAQAQHIIQFLMRHMNDIARTLHQAPDEYEPLLMENPNKGDPIPIIDEWCMGYMKGVQLDLEGWLPVTGGKPDWLSTILLYGTAEGWELLMKDTLSLDEHRELATGLADMVRNVHALFLEQRKKEMAGGQRPGVIRREPVRNPNKVGRNELCPCGSGKKYKVCHGSGNRLH